MKMFGKDCGCEGRKKKLIKWINRRCQQFGFSWRIILQSEVRRIRIPQGTTVQVRIPVKET